MQRDTFFGLYKYSESVNELFFKLNRFSIRKVFGNSFDVDK